MTFDMKALQGILVCPQSHSELVLDEEKLICTDLECRLQFDIQDGIPVMLVDEAQQLSDHDWHAAMNRNNRDTDGRTSDDESDSN